MTRATAVAIVRLKRDCKGTLFCGAVDPPPVVVRDRDQVRDRYYKCIGCATRAVVESGSRCASLRTVALNRRHSFVTPLSGSSMKAGL